MKKLLIIFILFVLGGLGIAGYNVLLSVGSNIMIDQVADDLLSEDEIDRLMNDPNVKSIINQDISTKADLPFHTKEEALKTVLKKFSIDELNDMKSKALHGTHEERAEIKAEVEERLSQEELSALKIVALKELQNRKK